MSEYGKDELRLPRFRHPRRTARLDSIIPILSICLGREAMRNGRQLSGGVPGVSPVRDVAACGVLFVGILLFLIRPAFGGRGDLGELTETKIFPGVVEVAFHSHVLDAPRKFCIVAPSTLESEYTDWPVLFFLHGRGRTHRSLVDIDSMRKAFLSVPFCTVFPQGDDGWYIDSPFRPGDRYEAYLKEVVELAAKLRPLSRHPCRRAIAGWSMGGYGAMMYALRNPQDMHAVVSIIGLLDFPRPEDLPEGQNYRVPTDRFGEDPSGWSHFNPIHRAHLLQGRRTLIITANDAFDRTMNERFSDRLHNEGVEHGFLLLSGRHTLRVVSEAVPHVLSFVQCKFIQACTSCSL